MFNQSKKASTFIYILLLINIAMIMWIVVFNNWFILNNNINIWKNAEEVFSSVHNKWNIALESVRKYNSNGNWYTDFISCPTNVTMSGSNNISTWITTNMVLDNWSIYCLWDYNWDEFRIYYNSNYTDFIKVYYSWATGNDIVDLDTPFKTSDLNLLSSNLESITSSGGTADNLTDGLESTEFESVQGKDSGVFIELVDATNLWKISFTKEDNWNASEYWNNWTIVIYDPSMVEIWNIGLKGMIDETFRESEPSMFYLNVKFISFVTDQDKILDLLDLYIYKAQVSSWWLDSVIETPWDFIRTWLRDYTDTDTTLVSFDGTWIWLGDNLDDNFNSDDYHVMSDIRDLEYYFAWFQDDDIVPRKTIFWSIPAWEAFDNIYWTNYKTIDFIDQNTNNNDILNMKAWDVTSWYMYLDISFENSEVNKSYDLKILEFSRDAWRDEFTLFPLDSLEGLDVDNKFWYISEDSNWNLYLSPSTWSWYVFDFQNKDYSLFLTNYADTSLSYRLRAETDTGTGIYINPIDDSGDDIKILANDIIIGWEKNFIWEEFIIVWDK